MRIQNIMLAISCLLFWGGSLTAAADDDDFNPENPADPAAIDICRITVSADPAEGAYVSGGGRYIVNGNSVYITTSASNTEDYTYTFEYWTLNGEKTSYSQEFWYTPTKGNFEFIAHYKKEEVVFDPENPMDPSATNVKRKYYLYLTSNIEGACSFSMDSGNKIAEETQLSISAYPNSDYQFECWKLNGQTISTDQYLWYTMPSANTTLQACFSEIPFDPENPSDPTGPSQNVDNSTRLIMDISIGDSQADSYVDRTRIVVNEAKTLGYDTGSDAAKMISDEADYQIYSLDADNGQYSVNERPTDNGLVPLGIIINKAGEAKISAIRLDCNATLIDKEKNVKTDLALRDYSFSCSKGTIEGRFFISLTQTEDDGPLGDANGDGKVNVEDIVTIISVINGNTPKGFMKKRADAIADGNIDAKDVTAVSEIIMNGSTN